MERRFFWNEERIAFFRDAAENGSFYERLAALIAPSLRPTDAVADLGCGLGYLSAALQPYCRSVTAIDDDPAAIRALNASAKDEDRLTVLFADVNTVPLPYDAIVCCCFGSAEEALGWFARSDAHTLILVKRAHPTRRFSDGAVHERTAEDARRTLIANGLPFSERSASLSLDQPFRSIKDAERFFASYRRGAPDPDAIGRLLKTEDPVFPYRLPVHNDLVIFNVSRS